MRVDTCVGCGFCCVVFVGVCVDYYVADVEADDGNGVVVIYDVVHGDAYDVGVCVVVGMRYGVTSVGGVGVVGCVCGGCVSMIRVVACSVVIIAGVVSSVIVVAVIVCLRVIVAVGCECDCV